ncbi:MAG: hypothetical protein OXF79_15300 [Chloroflexi bacterium]|nr:hypothetical protein [Chloroflexota bacterium]
MPPKEQLDVNKGFSFRIPQRDDYEFVSMIKSAYLMVFSLMGANGYKFAENIGLQPVREQIMNPDKKILLDGFVGSMQLSSEDYRKLNKPVVFLCRASNPPFWIIPTWNDKTIFLSPGALEPIDKLVIKPKEISLPNNSIVGWMAGRINGSSAMSGIVDNTKIAAGDTLAGALGGPIVTTRGEWLYIVVYHQGPDYVALPYCEDGHLPPSNAISIVNMLSKQEAEGQKLNQTQMAALDLASWSRGIPITPIDGFSNRNQEQEED